MGRSVESFARLRCWAGPDYLYQVSRKVCTFSVYTLHHFSVPALSVAVALLHEASFAACTIPVLDNLRGFAKL